MLQQCWGPPGVSEPLVNQAPGRPSLDCDTPASAQPPRPATAFTAHPYAHACISTSARQVPHPAGRGRSTHATHQRRPSKMPGCRPKGRPPACMPFYRHASTLCGCAPTHAATRGAGRCMQPAPPLAGRGRRKTCTGGVKHNIHAHAGLPHARVMVFHSGWRAARQRGGAPSKGNAKGGPLAHRLCRGAGPAPPPACPMPGALPCLTSR